MTHSKRTGGVCLALVASLATGCGAVDVNAESAAAQAPTEFGAQAQAASPGARFGTLCQSDYSGSWLHTLPSAWDLCANFNDELSSTDTQAFYWNLHGKKPYLETANDQDLAETVDLLFMGTHGGAFDPTYAAYAMWDYQVNAVTKNMSLGNEAHGLSILSTYSCDTLYNGDNKQIARWSPALGGGLRYVTGAWDLVWFGWTTDDVGEDYADDLQDGYTLRNAWADGTWDWYATNHPAVLATGTSESNCVSRKMNMKWTNYDAYSRLTTGSINWYCSTMWTF